VSVCATADTGSQLHQVYFHAEFEAFKAHAIMQAPSSSAVVVVESVLLISLMRDAKPMLFSSLPGYCCRSSPNVFQKLEGRSSYEPDVTAARTYSPRPLLVMPPRWEVPAQGLKLGDVNHVTPTASLSI
jgi:hypothetical protein